MDLSVSTSRNYRIPGGVLGEFVELLWLYGTGAPNARRQVMHGDVSFLELGSTEADTSKSQAFFAAVFGWQVHPMDQGGGWFQGPRIRVGLHGNDPGPKIYVFFEVPNLEVAMESVRHAGGHVDTLTIDEPDFGRFTNCRDPLGIPFGLHQPSAS